MGKDEMLNFDDLRLKINPLYEGEELVNKLLILPEVDSKVLSKGEKLFKLLELYKIFIPNKKIEIIYNNLYLSLVASLERKGTLDEVRLLNSIYKYDSPNKRFGMIQGVTDKNYITNSYHIHVTEEIDAFSKLAFESKFQELSPGGAISYVEVPNMNNNIPAVLDVMKFIYDNIMYAELNTKSDYCQNCGFDGEILIVRDGDNKLVWECPKCGNRDQSKLNVARRTCGYIGSQFWNQGRTQEIKERVLHL